MPEAKAIIGLGFRIRRGDLRGIEEGTFFAGYSSIGYANINEIAMPPILMKIGSFIEDNDYEAVIYSNGANRYGLGAGRPVSPDKPAPDVFIHFRIAAYICGMGEIGHSKVFLTPQFGPRQRFAFILTDTPLESDPIYNGPSLCDQCMRCVAECPAKAIPTDKSAKVEIEGKKLEWCDFDELKCHVGWQAASPEYNPFVDPENSKFMRNVIDDDRPREQKEDYAMCVAYNRLRKVDYLENGWKWLGYPAAICGARGCMRACMMHLEKKNMIKNTFKQPFQRRKPWKLESNEKTDSGVSFGIYKYE